ncbi:hypothetical protein [Cohnella sp. GCM10012308]|uniref:hypothetical protein n=1 Tax=Cohnella sp. GCM10012308 TaxID=3317329 RepID=UPI00360D3147
MSGLDQKGTAFPNGVNVPAGKSWSGDVKQPYVVASGMIAFDPPSLATGVGGVSSAIAIAGAALGDAVELYPPYDTQGVMAQASVSSAGNIKISLYNASAGTVDLASGTWGYAVKRRV